MARNSPRTRSCMLPGELAPANVAAMEAVGEVDLVDRAVGARPGVGEGVGDGGDSKDAATLGDKAFGSLSGAGVEDGYAFDLLGGLDLANESPARGGTGIPPRRDDDRDSMLAGQLRLELAEPSGRDGVEQLGQIAVNQRHDRLAFGIAEADVIFDQLGAFGRQ